MSQRPRAARIDEETLAAVHRRIGIRRRQRQRFHNETASTDSFRHFAEGCGDDNRLYCDAGYAEKSCWGGLIAPPTYPMTAGRARPVEWSEAEKEIMGRGDPLAGIHRVVSGERWVFTRPVRPGDALLREQFLYSAELRPTRSGDGRGALLSDRVGWEDEAGSPYCYLFLDSWHAHRDKPKDGSRRRSIERTEYTEEDLARIDACYAAEKVRGAEPRLISQVSVGEELGPIVRGPVCVTDVLAFNAGTGIAAHGAGAGKVAYKTRQRIPGMFRRNELGFWDSLQSCHWDDDYARQLGHPAAYDYGAMRTAWLVQLASNWMGDNAWLWKLSVATRKFNYMGDTNFMSGSVVSVDRSTGLVELDLKAVNQRDEVSCDARAAVILPQSPDRLVSVPDYDPSQVPEATGP